MWALLSCPIVVSVEEEFVRQEEKYIFKELREMTPPTGCEENACLGVIVTVLLSPVSHMRLDPFGNEFTVCTQKTSHV